MNLKSVIKKIINKIRWIGLALLSFMLFRQSKSIERLKNEKSDAELLAKRERFKYESIKERQDVESGNALDDRDIDERMRDKGYYRDRK